MKEIFTKEQRKVFAYDASKKIDANKGTDLKTAFECGYADMAKRTLRGAKDALGMEPTDFRDILIEKDLIPEFVKFLNPASSKPFDEWHKEMCDLLIDEYDTGGYKEFTVGKAQKWLNMAIKYACLYCYEYQGNLANHIGEFHVPIDRIIATPIVRDLGIALPEYDKFHMPPKEKWSDFDAHKKDYAWSQIQDYDSYLRCQKEIREKCKEKNYESPLHWEFAEWLAQRHKEQK